MKILTLILAASAFTILLISLYPFRHKYDYPLALPTPTPVRFQPTPTEEPWQTYRNNQYGFEFQYPLGGFDPNYTVDQTNLSYSEIIKKIKSDVKSETKILINNKNFNLYTAQIGDLGIWSFAYFSHLKHNYEITLGGFSESDIHRILSSIIFFTPSKQYSCPTSEWVDCMPSPDSPPKPQCQSDYLNWAQKNCPNFKGAAL